MLPVVKMSPTDDKNYDTLDEVFEDINDKYAEAIGALSTFYRESGFGYAGLPEPGSPEDTERFLNRFRDRFDNPEELEKAYETWTELISMYKDMAAEASAGLIDKNIPDLNTLVDCYVDFVRTQVELEKTLQEELGLSVSDVRVNEETEKGKMTLQEVIERLE